MSNPAYWCLLRGQQDGRRWAEEVATLPELLEWGNIWLLENYPGEMPFPFENAAARKLYEQASEAARQQGFDFSRRFYAIGFAESVCRVWHERYYPEGLQ